MRIIFTVFLSSFLALSSMAQCDTIASVCANHLSAQYISDGQFYRSLLYEDQIAEFQTTLFAGTEYRVATCSGFEDGNLIISVFDEKRNLLFTNSEYDNSPYWNFSTEATMNVTIEARLDLNKLNSGCAVVLIGFKP